MDNKLKIGALGIAVLFVFAMSAVPGAAEQRVEVPDLTFPASGHGCDLSAPGDSCVGASFIYGGEAPALDAAETLVAAGAFTVRIQELPPFTETWWVETTFSVVIVAGEAIVSVDEHAQGDFTPSVGWPVEIVGDSAGLALPSVTATA